MTYAELFPIALVASATVINWRWARHLQRRRYFLDEQDLLQRIRRLNLVDDLKKQASSTRDAWKVAMMHADANRTAEAMNQWWNKDEQE